MRHTPAKGLRRSGCCSVEGLRRSGCRSVKGLRRSVCRSAKGLRRSGCRSAKGLRRSGCRSVKGLRRSGCRVAKGLRRSGCRFAKGLRRSGCRSAKGLRRSGCRSAKDGSTRNAPWPAWLAGDFSHRPRGYALYLSGEVPQRTYAGGTAARVSRRAMSRPRTGIPANGENATLRPRAPHKVSAPARSCMPGLSVSKRCGGLWVRAHYFCASGIAPLQAQLPSPSSSCTRR